MTSTTYQIAGRIVTDRRIFASAVLAEMLDRNRSTAPAIITPDGTLIAFPEGNYVNRIELGRELLERAQAGEKVSLHPARWKSFLGYEPYVYFTTLAQFDRFFDEVGFDAQSHGLTVIRLKDFEGCPIFRLIKPAEDHIYAQSVPMCQAARVHHFVAHIEHIMSKEQTND